MGRIDRANARWMNGKELKALQLTWALLGTMENGSGEALRERLSSVPGAWNAWRLAAGWLKKALRMMVSETVSIEQQKLCEHVLRYGTIDIGIRASREEDMVVMHAQDFQVIANEAMHAQCAMCFLDERGIRRCPLRRALLRAAPPQSLETAGCVYRDVVIASEKPGEYIEI